MTTVTAPVLTPKQLTARRAAAKQELRRATNRRQLALATCEAVLREWRTAKAALHDAESAFVDAEMTLYQIEGAA